MSTQYSWRRIKPKTKPSAPPPELTKVAHLLARTDFAQSQALRRRVRLRVWQRIEARQSAFSTWLPTANAWMRAVALFITLGFFISSLSLLSGPETSFSGSDTGVSLQFAAPVAGNGIAPMLSSAPVATPGGSSWMNLGRHFAQTTPLAIPIAHPKLQETQPSAVNPSPISFWTTTPLPDGTALAPILPISSN